MSTSAANRGLLRNKPLKLTAASRPHLSAYSLDGQVTRSELEALWTKIREQLAYAVALLPNPARQAEYCGTVAGYREFLEHNELELELAFDELESLGLANEVGDEYWAALATAAQLMSLSGHEKRCRSRLNAAES